MAHSFVILTQSDQTYKITDYYPEIYDNNGAQIREEFLYLSQI